MNDLNSALDSAFEEERDSPGQNEAAPAAPEPEPAEASEPEAEAKPESAAAEPTITKEEFYNPTAEELAAIQKDPALKKAYESFRRGFNKKTEEVAELRKRSEMEFAEQKRLWDALNNPQTQRQAVEALARAVGLPVTPSDQPQREQAAAVADNISEEWSKVVGPEAAQLLRPLIEKTALEAVKGTIEPMKIAADHVFMDARMRQAEAQVNQFRSLAKEKGWELTPEVEARMAQLGQEMVPSKPIESVDEGVRFMERLYRAASSDDLEAKIEKRILERMNKAAQSAEPARGVPSTGREKRSNITREMSLNEALDVAMQEVVGGR